MIHSGLVSITFRQLPPREIVDLVVRAGLAAIEWGGDVHVPHGDLARAAEVAARTADAGLAAGAYGSYYRVGHDEPAPFETVLETAEALGTSLIRVWAGKKASAEADEDYRRRVVDESIRIAEQAERAGTIVAYEYHGHTLTDTLGSARRLLDEVTHPNVQTYWQPPRDGSLDECIASLGDVLGRLANLHVFHWDRATGERLPLASGRADWLTLLRIAAATGRAHFAMLEFVRDNDPEAFLEDAVVLREMLSRLEDPPHPAGGEKDE